MDHIVSIIIFLAAILLFVSFFGNTIQTAVVYQTHQGIATKCSDLLDNMLLNPGSPSNWGQSNVAPASFGVQDPEFTQYELSCFSLMRLSPSSGDTFVYDKMPSEYYTGFTTGPGAELVTSNAKALNYTEALKLLGINGTYGFQLSLTPDITVSVAETHASSPLTLAVTAMGAGFPFANSTVNYCLMLTTMGKTDAEYPSYTIINGSAVTNEQGIASISIVSVTNPDQVYAFVAYAHVAGVAGVGFHVRDSETDQSVVPIVEDMGSQDVVLAHGADLNNTAAPTEGLKYNATFVICTRDNTLSELALASSPDNYGTLMSGLGNPVVHVTLPTSMAGILIVTYQESPNQGGVILMPWGISALSFPISFGGNSSQHEWVATDLRQVVIGGITYQAKLSLWSEKNGVVTG